LIILGVFLVLGLTLSSLETAIGQDNVEEQVFDAFRAIAEAERSDGDVSSLKDELNVAIEIVETAQATGNDSLIQDAMAKLEDIIASAVTVGQEGAVESQRRLMFISLYVGVFGVSSFLVYRYVPIIFWTLWVKVKKGWRVRAANR